MAIALVQSGFQLVLVSQSSGTASNMAAPAAGNLLVMPLMWINTLTVSSITDTAGNSWVQVPGAASVGSNHYQSDIWYCQNCLAGAAFYSCTITMSGVALRLRATFSEWSGARLSGVVNTAGNISGPGSPVGPAITPSVSGQLLVSTISSNDNTITGRTAGWTALPSQAGESNEVDYFINPALSSQQVVYQPTTSEDFGSSAASFFPPSTGPSNAVKTGAFLVIP